MFPLVSCSRTSAATLLAGVCCLAVPTSSVRAAAILLDFGQTAPVAGQELNSPAHEDGTATGTTWNQLNLAVDVADVNGDGGSGTLVDVDLGLDSSATNTGIKWTPESGQTVFGAPGGNVLRA
jgi:hypothetical protein